MAIPGNLLTTALAVMPHKGTHIDVVFTGGSVSRSASMRQPGQGKDR